MRYFLVHFNCDFRLNIEEAVDVREFENTFSRSMILCEGRSPSPTSRRVPAGEPGQRGGASDLDRLPLTEAVR